MKETDITPQQLWRTAVGSTKHDPNREDGGPSPIWRAQFKAQATQDMMDDVYGYVAKRATWIEHQSGRRSPGLIREMIQDALGDTFAGIVTWDPSKCSLALHLKSVIRSRLSHEFERAEQFEHLNVADAPEVEVHEVLAAGAKTNDPNLGEYIEEFERRLRALAVDDDAVLTLLDTYLAGLTERAQICRATSMTKAAYHNAHRRLKRLFLEHQQGRRLGERLVLARDLALELLDALAFGRSSRGRRSDERLVERDTPGVELLAMNAAPAKQLSQLLVAKTVRIEHELHPLLRAPVLRTPRLRRSRLDLARLVVLGAHQPKASRTAQPARQCRLWDPSLPRELRRRQRAGADHATHHPCAHQF